MTLAGCKKSFATGAVSFGLISFLFFSSLASADYYVTFTEKKIPTSRPASLEIQNHFELQAFTQAASDLVSLLDWLQHSGSAPQAPESYSRKKHYGSWISAPGDCKNTRAKVLIRDSQAPVTFTNAQNCTVDKGQWYDPYSDQDYSSSKDVQVDHFVPLKNSYISGGWSWDKKKKCMYANFMGNSIHLIPVEGSQNNTKSDKAPDGYLPPNQNFICEYLQRWLKVKMIWGLSMTESETQAIEQSYQQNSCSKYPFAIPESELNQQRALINDSTHACYTSPQSFTN